MKPHIPKRIFRRPAQPTHVQVGIDFGTSATKVAFAVRGTAHRTIRPMLFDHRLRSYPAYCVPSIIAFADGDVVFGAKAAAILETKNWGRGIRRLKILVAGAADATYRDASAYSGYLAELSEARLAPTTVTPELLAAAFLATVMRRIRIQLSHWLSSAELDIAFNVCVPIDQIQNNVVYAAFSRVVAAAEVIERHMHEDRSMRGFAWLDDAANVLGRARYDEHDPDARAFLVPEPVAEIASYVTSLKKRAGLHALVDIGAGTTEISVFNLAIWRQRSPTSFWYAAKTVPMGMSRIESIVAESLGPSDMVAEDAVLRAMTSASSLDHATRQKMQAVMQEIWNQTSFAWCKAYGHYSTQSAWMKNAVQVFLAGGGANHPAAKSVFAKSWMTKWGPYPTSLLPAPDDYDAMNNQVPFSRLCVAYGLARPKPELGEFILPNDCPDHTPPRPSLKHVPDRNEVDELLPTDGWPG